MWATSSLESRIEDRGVRALLGTLALLVAYGVATTIPLPGTSWREIANHGGPANLLMLGAAPATSAYLLVEFCALLVPPWRSLRTSGARGRAILERAVSAVTLLLAGFQAFAVIRALEEIEEDMPFSLFEGPFARSVVALSLVAGAAAALWLARAVSRQGLVNGFVVLGLAASATAIFDSVATLYRSTDPVPLTSLAAALTLPVLATWTSLRGTTAAADPSRAVDPPRRGAAFRLPVPAGTLKPVLAAWAITELARALGRFCPEGVRSWAEGLYTSRAGALEVVLITSALGVALSFAFHRPRDLTARLVKLGVAPEEAERQTRSALRSCLVASVLLTATLSAVDLVAVHTLGVYGSSLGLALLTAAVLDFLPAFALHRAGGFRCVWRDPRPQLLPLMQAALAREGIQARALFLGQAAQWRIFGPYVLAELHVPREHEKQARAVARSLAEAPPAAPSGGTLDSELELLADFPARRTLELAALAAVALLLAMLAVASP